MTREEIVEIFPEADEAQIIALMQKFDENAGELFVLRRENEQMKQQLEQHAAEKAGEAQAAAREKLVERFDKAVGDREFVHDLVRESVQKEFLDMLQAEENAGRSDKEMLRELTEDKGCFVKRYQVTMGEIGNVAPEDVNRLSDAEYYAAFRMKGVQ